jgi:hypothetical protein
MALAIIEIEVRMSGVNRQRARTRGRPKQVKKSAVPRPLIITLGKHELN